MTWACKKKSNCTYCAQLNARRFKQIVGKHFNPMSTAAPVTNNVTIINVLLLMLLVDWMVKVYDVKSASLKGKFEDGKEIFKEVPQGMEHHHWDLAIHRLFKPIYGLKQAALLFWQRLLKITKNMGHV